MLSHALRLVLSAWSFRRRLLPQCNWSSRRDVRPSTIYDIGELSRIIVTGGTSPGIGHRHSLLHRRDVGRRLVLERVIKTCKVGEEDLGAADARPIRVLTPLNYDRGECDHAQAHYAHSNPALRCANNLALQRRRTRALMVLVHIFRTSADRQDVDVTAAWNELVVCLDAKSCTSISCVDVISIFAIRGVLTWKEFACACIRFLLLDLDDARDSVCQRQRSTMVTVIHGDLRESHLRPDDDVATLLAAAS